MIVGIDLGTTYSAVSVLRDGKPEVLPNSLGDFLTPSVVAFEDGEILIGKTARELMTLKPDLGCAVFKRQMGTDWSVVRGERARSAVELSALVLAQLKRDAEAALGKPVERAVITVPAYFNDAQRTATIEAGEAAGLIVERIINEPTAAAIAYGLHESDAERTAVVIDLGGGTFDVSVIEQFERVVEVRSSAGEVFLGGEDFTSAIVSRVLMERGETLEVSELKCPGRVARLRRECEIAKRKLSEDSSATVRWPAVDGTVNEESETIVIERSVYESWTKPLLDRILRPLKRALTDAHLGPADIDEVILVGGATRMASVRTLAAELFGKEPRASLPPDQVVAIGAAIQGGLVERNADLGDLVVTDVCPFTLGIETSREIGHQLKSGFFLPILPRNTPLPTSRVERVGTLSANQTKISVKVFQGESRTVEGNLLLGEFECSGIPIGPPGQEVDVQFTYDLNGVLEAEATVVKTRKKASLVISRHAKNKDARAIRKAVAAMAELKKDWRHRTENRMLILKAERLFQELTGTDRDELDGILTAFEAALADKNEEASNELRNMLMMYLSARDIGFETDGDGFPDNNAPPDNGGPPENGTDEDLA